MLLLLRPVQVAENIVSAPSAPSGVAAKNRQKLLVQGLILRPPH